VTAIFNENIISCVIDEKTFDKSRDKVVKIWIYDKNLGVVI
jgi:hypothetical protein